MRFDQFDDLRSPSVYQLEESYQIFILKLSNGTRYDTWTSNSHDADHFKCIMLSVIRLLT